MPKPIKHTRCRLIRPRGFGLASRKFTNLSQTNYSTRSTFSSQGAPTTSPSTISDAWSTLQSSPTHSPANSSGQQMWQTPLLPSKCTTAVALRMEVPIQTILNRVGEAIHSNLKCSFSSLGHLDSTSQRSLEVREDLPQHYCSKKLNQTVFFASMKNLGGRSPYSAISDDSGK